MTVPVNNSFIIRNDISLWEQALVIRPRRWGSMDKAWTTKTHFTSELWSFVHDVHDVHEVSPKKRRQNGR